MRLPSKIYFAVAVVLLLLVAPASPADKPVVHFGVSLRFDPIKMYEHYQPLMDYLSRNTPYTFKLRISRDYGDGLRDLREGKADIAALGDGAVIGAMLRDGAVPIVKPLNAQLKPLYRCYFVVSEKSAIRTLSDLKGKRLALGFHHSLTGNLVPRQMLNKSGIKQSDLAAMDNLRNHTAATKAVIKGEYDAGAVKDVVATLYQKHGLRIIAASEAFPSVPLVARKGTRPQLIAAVTSALVRLDYRNPAHREILKSWDEEYQHGFVPTKLGDYRNIFRMYRAFPYSCGRRCHG